jgi:hypothetical protein
MSDEMAGSCNKHDCTSFILWLAVSVLNYIQFFDSADLPLYLQVFLLYVSVTGIYVDL